MLEAVITTESEKMKIPRVFEAGESSRHGRKGYNLREGMSSQNRKRAAKVRAIPGAQRRGTWGNHPTPENSLFSPGSWTGPPVVAGVSFVVINGAALFGLRLREKRLK